MQSRESPAVQGVLLTPLKRISLAQGDVLHAMKASDRGACGFGEAYFSIIHHGETKGWKKHTKMTLNLVVPVGCIRFVIYDDRPDSTTSGQFMSLELSPGNYQRLTIPAGLWMAFHGCSEGLNLLLNVADIEHDPAEVERCELSDISFEW